MVQSRYSSRVMDMAGPLLYFVGDALPDLQIELDYESGGPVVLTGATVTVSIARLKGSSAVKTGTATLTDALNGFAVFSWGAFTFGSPGTYIGQVRVTYSGGAPLSSQKFLIEVAEKVPGL